MAMADLKLPLALRSKISLRSSVTTDLTISTYRCITSIVLPRPLLYSPIFSLLLCLIVRHQLLYRTIPHLQSPIYCTPPFDFFSNPPAAAAQAAWYLVNSSQHDDSSSSPFNTMSLVSSFLSAMARTRRVPQRGWNVLTGKQKRNFNKGKRSMKTGFLDNLSNFRVVPSMLPKYIIPNLNSCNLKPYVAHKANPKGQ